MMIDWLLPHQIQTQYFRGIIIKSSEFLKVRTSIYALDEVPIVLNELNDASIKYMSKEQYEKALILL